jgi:hypothetical protein
MESNLQSFSIDFEIERGETLGKFIRDDPVTAAFLASQVYL